MNSDETGLQIDDKEKALTEALQIQYEINTKILETRKAILIHQVEIKDLQMQQDIADHNVKKINLELSGLKRLFWKIKGENR